MEISPLYGAGTGDSGADGGAASAAWAVSCGGNGRFALDEDEQRIYLINFDKDGNERIGYFDL